MAVIGIRDLLRSPKEIFDALGESREPFLVTKHGRPIAAIYPVDASQAERLMLETAPEYVEARRVDEHARAEGRTQSLEDAIREYNATVEADKRIALEDEPAKPAEEPSSSPSDIRSDEAPDHDLVPMVELRAVFGEERAGAVARDATQRIAAMSESLVDSAARAGLLESEQTGDVDEPKDRSEVIRRVEELSAQLFGGVMREALLRATADRVVALEADDAASLIEPEGMFGQQLAEETLETAHASVQRLNDEILKSQSFRSAGGLVRLYALCSRERSLTRVPRAGVLVHSATRRAVRFPQD